MLAEKARQPNLNFVFLLIGPLLVLLPMIQLQPTASEIIFAYSGMIMFTVLGLQAFLVAYFANKVGQRPFEWCNHLTKKDFVPIAYASIVAAGASILITFVGVQLDVPFNERAYIGMIPVGILSFWVLLHTKSVLSAAIVHFTYNALAVVSSIADFNIIKATSDLVFAPLAEEQIKLSFALGVAILFLSPTATKRRLIIGMVTGYVIAIPLWMYSHCVVYPLPIFPC